MMENIREMENKFPLITDMEQAKEVIWINPGLLDMKDAMKGQTLSMADIDDAERRWDRFAPFIKKAFPETEASGGLIESPLKEIPKMQQYLNDTWKAELTGRLLLKMDSDLAVAGSVKARGGIYEILNCLMKQRLIVLKNHKHDYDNSEYLLRFLLNRFFQYN